MLSKEENELLTQTGPGTSMGELFRRFWLPAMLSSELPEPDCTPVRLRLLGEDLITFRDTEGRVGCLDAYCPHRGAALFFGRNEENGLRCIYHGWKFNVDGDCVHMPNCVEGESYREKVMITAYPSVEGGGLIWFYMGPRERIPPLPGFEWFHLPTTHTHVAKYIYHSNYMQALEGDFDPGHNDFLHMTLDDNRSNPSRAITGNTSGSIPGWKEGFKPRIVNAWDNVCGVGQALARSGDSEEGLDPRPGPGFMLPCFDAIGLGPRGTRPVNIKVPSDDEHTIYFRVRWSLEQPLTDEQLRLLRVGGYINPPVVPGTFMYEANKFNDYLIDRIKQKHFTFSGISQTAVQDTAMQENQRGPIMDRTKEHLTSTDTTNIRIRQRLMRLANELRAGEEPLEPFKPEGYTLTGQIPISETPLTPVALS